MKKICITVLVAVVALIAASDASAQGRRGLRLNEVMVTNDSSVTDDYGRRSAWVELFNSTFAPLEISSVFITDDPSNPKKYPVPLGDVNTRIPKRQHVVFWADGQPSKGTFHMTFTLREGQDNWIGVYDADGKTLIDEVTVPASLAPNTTYARSEDGTGEWEVRDGSGARHVTPSSANVIRDTNSKVEMFAERDENGFGMTVMAMCIVFSALLLLSVCFYVISTIRRATRPSRTAPSFRSSHAKSVPTPTRARPSQPSPWRSTSISTPTTARTPCSPSTRCAKPTRRGTRRSTTCVRRRVTDERQHHSLTHTPYHQKQ